MDALCWPWEPLRFSVILSAVGQTIRSAGFVDLFDIAAVATVIYFALSWTRRARAFRILQGMFVSVILYAAARRMGLSLTTSLFRGISTIIAVMLLGLFQEDLRRFFERLTLCRQIPLARGSLEAIERSMKRLKDSRTGAIVVLKGRDPLERHVSGGQTLGGLLSSALLESLFDPHSDGHDGAVIIEGDRVTRFGVHLPLSKNLDHDSGLGTRHAAALGLSEATDALCLVVSEQRGTLSIAQHGRLISVNHDGEFRELLRGFLGEDEEPGLAASLWDTARNHSIEKVFSIAAGAVLWLVIAKGVRPTDSMVPLKIQPSNIPAHLLVAAIEPPMVEAELKVLVRDLHRSAPEGLSVRVDLSKARAGVHRVPLDAKTVQLPANLALVGVTPPEVSILLRPTGSKPSAPSSAVNSRRAWFHWK